MSKSLETAKVKLVTIVAPGELRDGLEEHLRSTGATGYTIVRADGRGKHGPREAGFLAFANVRIETLMRAGDAVALLQYIASAYAEEAVMAFVQDVEAVPKAHFE